LTRDTFERSLSLCINSSHVEPILTTLTEFLVDAIY